MRFQRLACAMIVVFLFALSTEPAITFIHHGLKFIQSPPNTLRTFDHFSNHPDNQIHLGNTSFLNCLNLKSNSLEKVHQQYVYPLYTSSGQTIRISIAQRIRTTSGSIIPATTALFVNDLRDGDKVARQLQNYTFLHENGYLKENRIRVILLIGSPISPCAFALNPLLPSSLNSLYSKFQEFNCRIHSTFNCFPFLAVELPYKEIFNLACQDYIVHIFLDAKVSLCLDESVPLIKPPVIWNQLETQFGLSINGIGVRIAILDSGIDRNHPDLDDLDDDPATNDPKVIAEACFTGEGFTQDHRGHGTHCASIAAGTGNVSGYQFVGVAPGAFILNGKVIHDMGYGTDSWIINGIEWAVSENADIISMSFGSYPSGGSGDGSDPLSLTVDWAVNQGVICTIAAGGFGSWGEFSIATPGVAKQAITVGVTNQADIVLLSSSRGPTGDYRLKPDVCAPGYGIIAARANDTSMGNPVNEFYTSASGTSMATAHVAGAAALILQAHPTWNPLMVKSSLMGNAKPLEDTDLWRQGAGRIQVCEALNTTLLVIQPSISLGNFNNTAINTNSTLIIMNLADTPTNVDLSTYTSCEYLETSGVSVNETSISIPPQSNRNILLSVDLDELAIGGWYQGRLTLTNSQNNKTTPYFFVKSVPPIWNPLPSNQFTEYGYSFQYGLNAMDRDGLDTWWLNDTTHFSIDTSGIITNRTKLAIGTYGVQVWVNDTFNLILTSTFRITVQDTLGPVWTITPTNQVLEYGTLLGYQLYATDLSGIARWSVDDTTHFSISSNGLLTNNLLLEPGEYSVNLTVFDVYDNTLSATIIITVQAPPPPQPPPPVPGYPWISIFFGFLFGIIPVLILRSKQQRKH